MQIWGVREVVAFLWGFFALKHSAHVKNQSNLSVIFKTNITEYEIQLIKKTGCYKLMELMYSRLPKEEVYSKESCINKAYCRSDKTEGNELSKILIK